MIRIGLAVGAVCLAGLAFMRVGLLDLKRGEGKGGLLRVIHGPFGFERVAVQADETLGFDFEDYRIKGWQLSKRQFERGLPKRLERRQRRDQSFEGLRDIIEDSADSRLERLLPHIGRLEAICARQQPTADPDYSEAFIEYMTPICLYLQRELGIPASVVLSQIILESGWGGSNVTILKNNVLGLGNADAPEQFEVMLETPRHSYEIKVRCPEDTSAFHFEDIGSSVMYYAYVLLQSEENAVHYAELRDFIDQHRPLLERDPPAYRQGVIERIASSYHHDPEWYMDYLARMTRSLSEIERLEVAMARFPGALNGSWGGARATVVDRP